MNAILKSAIQRGRTVLLYAALGLLLAACGQKGPLFLPGNPSEIRPQPPAGEPAPETDEEEESEGAARL